MMVAAEPILLDKASPSRKGKGFICALSNATVNTGVKARQTMSFANTADKAALVSIINKRKSWGRCTKVVIRRAVQV